jgi:threonine dehydrogenase-like Zn-dependent dehydrogenase
LEVVWNSCFIWAERGCIRIGMKALIYDIKPARWALCKLLKPVYKRSILGRLGGLSLREIDPPALPGPDWVRVSTRMAGLCGTDAAIVAQKQRPDSILQAFSSMPMLLGHENVSEVVEVGQEVDRAWLGRRVCVEPTLSCRVRGIDPPCPPCSRGQFGACENFAAAGRGRSKLPPGTSIGYNNRTGGAYGEQFVAHKSQLVPVPEGLGDAQAVLTDALACSLHAALAARLEGARRVLVYGCGTLGLGLVSCLRAMGFDGQVDALGRRSYLEPVALGLGAWSYLRLPASGGKRFEAIAQRTGATQQIARFGNRMLSGGYDVVFDCVGSVGSVNEALKWTAARGEVIMVATTGGGRIDLTPVWFRELSVRGIYGRQIETWQGRRVGTYQLVLEWLGSGKLRTDGLLTHVFAIEDYRKAFEAAIWKRDNQAIKIAFDFRRQE